MTSATAAEPGPLQRRVKPGTVVLGILLAAVALWILFFTTGTNDPVIAEPGKFAVTLLNAITLAALLFVVASGFTLIFGLMRTVNMAHGSLFILSALAAIEVQRAMVDAPRPSPEDVSMVAWLVPLLVGTVVAMAFGVVMHQLLLRWNQGQDLRQALITIAVSVILTDQLLGRYPIAQNAVWPGGIAKFFEILGERYPLTRLFMGAVGLVVGTALWLWLTKTRMGMIVRAGVDDKDMVRALGINISLAFGITFAVGAALAGVGGFLEASRSSSVAVGLTDGAWLLNSLIVVIIGGLGSIKGAAVGALLFAFVDQFGPVYLPVDFTSYSTILTFVLLAAVLAVKPNGLYGKAS